MTNPFVEAEYPIAAVSKLTGVSCHALRVWERRYGFPIPHRSASGHRRYALDQVLTLRRLSELTHSGRPISELIAEVRAGRLVVEPCEKTRKGEGDSTARLIEEFLDRLVCGDFSSGDAHFDRLEAILAPDELINRVIAPSLTEVGERWFRRRYSIFQERCVSGFLRRRLDAMIQAARQANVGPTRGVVVGTVQGDRHEGGVLIAHLLLERSGWRVINLGVDLPVTEYARAVEHLRPDALALSFVLSRNVNKRFQELSELRGVPIFVGGRSILNYQGLARRFGLIPLPGSVTEAMTRMVGEFEAWQRRHKLTPPIA